MSLTKKDKKEIKTLIGEAIDSLIKGTLDDLKGYHDDDDEAQEIQTQINEWETGAINTGLGFVMAPEDYHEGDKQHFTWDEAMDIQENIKASGWRLPTVAEWVQMYGRFGIDVYGHDDPDALSSQLLLKKAGYYFSGSFNGGGGYGGYWSSTASSTSNAYYLSFYSSFVNPQYNYSKAYYGFSVRMIKEVKNES